MAQGSLIIVAGEPRGVEVRGLISGTPKPGTALLLKPATARSNGLFTYQASGWDYNGQKGPLILLDGDWEQGKLATDAYATGTPFKGYVPLVGERVNFLVKASSGAVTIGQRYMIDSATGKFIWLPTQAADYTTGGGDTEAELIAAINLNRRVAVIKALEAFADPGSDTLCYGEVVANC